MLSTKLPPPGEKYRVILYLDKIHMLDSMHMNKNQVFWEAARAFKTTLQYAWVENNGIQLQWAEDENILAWHKQVVFYADVDEQLFVDYTLRFA
jgi:hypothetical protein